ncbi:hypothetical protein V5E97_04170 [Singulisphaera sp. Ch08]|uniref:Uncharacterized protein n=1 Tax=Singulisphaera sp. Ch08 TaxID=3120278 RepID=A0AAU7CJG5_9BACT
MLSPHKYDHWADNDAAEEKKKITITAESFDHQVADRMDGFFEEVVLPTLKTLAEARLSYDKMKRLVKLPSTWEAKISGKPFRERLNSYLIEVALQVNGG